MATSHPNQHSNEPFEWVDVADEDSNLASVALTVQNVGERPISVYFGGGTAPSEDQDGQLLAPGVGVNGTAANIWVSGIKGFDVSFIEND